MDQKSFLRLCMGQREVLTVHAFFRPVMLAANPIINVKMAAGRAIWLLRLFVLFFLLCEVRRLKGIRKCNVTTTHRI